MSRAEDNRAILRRLERKAEVLKLEFKATGNTRKYDMDEMLSLIEMLKKNLTMGKQDV